MSKGELPDVSHPDTFEKGFPHELFARLRRDAPVCWHEGDYEGGRGYWIISRYRTIKAISRRPMLFSSAAGTSIEDSRGDFVSMIGMDPPDHRRYRALVSSGFTPSGRKASCTAFAMAPRDAVQPDSPTPLTPSGLTFEGVECSFMRISRTSPARGMM